MILFENIIDKFLTDSTMEIIFLSDLFVVS